MSTVTQGRALGEPAPAPAQAPPYGWRYVVTTRPDGTTDLSEMPLMTLEDVLHPEPDDSIPVSTLHDLVRNYLADVFRARTLQDPTALVISDVDVYWDIPGLKQHRPDVGVVFGVRNRDANRTSFFVANEGVRPRVLVEIVSPHLRKNDVETKVVHYHQAQVPYYIVLDRVKEDDPWQVRGYEYAPAGYVEMAKDARGRLWLADIGVWLGADGQRVICCDGATGAPIGDYEQITRELQAAQESVVVETARAEAEKARAEAEKARAEAEKARADTAKARADAEAEARRQAEARLRELEAEVALLRGQPPSA